MRKTYSEGRVSPHIDFVIYGKEGAKFEKDLGKDFLNNLKSVVCTGILLNVNVVFWSGHSAAYISYDDTIMSVPFDKPLDKAGFDQSFKDLLVCFNALTEE